MHYHAKTNGFYDPKIGAVPEDAVEISDSKYQELMEGASKGLMISSDERGNPILKTQEALTPEGMQKTKNKKSKAYLAETDWYVVRKVETGVEIPQQILDARAEARLSIVE